MIMTTDSKKLDYFYFCSVLEIKFEGNLEKLMVICKTNGKFRARNIFTHAACPQFLS